MLERDQQEILEDAAIDAEIEDERDDTRDGGYYTIEFIESYTNGLENLVFVYGGDEEDKESLLIEPRLVHKSSELIPGAVEAILTHMRITSPAQGWSKAFNQRFSEELEAEHGIVKITAEDVEAWLFELREVAQHHGR